MTNKKKNNSNNLKEKERDLQSKILMADFYVRIFDPLLAYLPPQKNPFDQLYDEWL